MMTFLVSSNNPSLISIVAIGIVIILVSGILRAFKQPYIIAYILVGVLAGDHGFRLLTDREVIQPIGEFGLIILLFFIGMEISLPRLLQYWKVPTIGTLLQTGGSVLMVAIIGWFNGWGFDRILVLGFITSLSSSAVVIKLLQDNDEIETRTGQSVVSILLMQDILIVPLLIITNYVGGTTPSVPEVALQIIGGLLIIGGIIWIIRKKHISLPFSDKIDQDHELQVFLALVICFGFAVITSFFGLSAALGAFVGGMFIHAARSTEWIHDVMHSFRVIFVAVFFISIGMLIDLSFLLEYWEIILVLLVAVYLGNHLINSVIIHSFQKDWKASLYGGALLAQIGELSFVLASSAYYSEIMSDFEYQLAIIIISLTLLISPFWIATTKKIVGFHRDK